MNSGLLQKLIYSFIILCTYGVHAEGSNSHNIKIASMEIPYAYSKEGDGVYNKILNRLTDGYKGTLDINFYPAARFNRLIINHNVDCGYIATESILNWQEFGISSENIEFIGPINTLNVVLYIPIFAPDITTIDEVKSLQIAADINLVDTLQLLGIKETFAFQNQITMLRLFELKRVNGLIGYDFDFDFLSKKMGIDNKIKKASIRLDHLEDGIACFKTEKTAPFRKHLKRRLEDISSSGWLAAALKDY